MGNPEPDREEFHGPIAEHITDKWGDIPKRMRGAILDTVAGQRKGPHPSSVKLAEGVGFSVSEDGRVIARGTGGKFASHDKFKRDFDNLCRDPPSAWRTKKEQDAWDSLANREEN